MDKSLEQQVKQAIREIQSPHVVEELEKRLERADRAKFRISVLVNQIANHGIEIDLLNAEISKLRLERMMEDHTTVNNYTMGVGSETRQGWEYYAFSLSECDGVPNADRLNKLGAKGWEYCANTPVKGGWCSVLLKRPLQPRRPLTSDELFEKAKAINEALGGKVVEKKAGFTEEESKWIRTTLSNHAEMFGEAVVKETVRVDSQGWG